MRNRVLVLILFLILFPSLSAHAQTEVTPTPSPTELIPPTPAEIINAVNDLRIANGLAPLYAHPVLMEIAQTEASGIANGKDGHWRPDGLTLGQWMISLGYPLSGDLTMDGYRSENWVAADTAEEAISIWLMDDPHTNTMLSIERSDIGAGVAVSDRIYVVIETALRTASGQMQSEAHLILTGIPQTKAAYSALSTEAARLGLLPEDMAPAAISTALENGDVIHEVQYGQTLWTLAILYGTTIRQIQQFNNLWSTTINPGDKLLIQRGATRPIPTSLGGAMSTITPAPSVVFDQTATPSPISSSDLLSASNRSTTVTIGVVVFSALVLGVVFIVTAKQKF